MNRKQTVAHESLVNYIIITMETFNRTGREEGFIALADQIKAYKKEFNVSKIGGIEFSVYFDTDEVAHEASVLLRKAVHNKIS